ncbi:MAG: hypothetical protein NTU58_03340 [Candidatus Nealsonbacteria bacterium]|nr:hypothetical protein [Candidatus Nealsonbacteria bacterium]
MSKNKISGYIMTIIGFAMILTNAIGYIFRLDIKSSAFGVMGIVFVLIGLKIARKEQK